MTETFPLTSGATHYACFFQGANVFNATSQAMVAASGATQAQCSVAMSEIGSSGLFYITTAPTGLPAGRYTIVVFKETSPGTAAFSSDSRKWVDDTYDWSGSARVGLGSSLSVSVSGSDIASIWSYSSRTLTSGVVQLVTPWQVGTITLIKGNSYLNADSTAIGITKATTAVWPSDLVSGGYTITFTCTPTQKTTNDSSSAVGFTTTTGAVVSASSIRLGDMTAAVTAGLTIPKANGTNAYSYQVTASRSAGAIVHTLERGMLSVG
jgi:hypothetical protein